MDFNHIVSLEARSLFGGSHNTTGVNVVLENLHYVPSKVLAGIAGGCYAGSAILLFLRLASAKSWWGLCLPIGAICVALGFLARIGSAIKQTSIPFYVLQQLLIICAPAAFLAFNYILYGQFIVRCVGPEYSLIRPQRVARIFVISDITTFLIQSCGGSLEAQSWGAKFGSKLFLVGLIAQALSYVFFVGLFTAAFLRLKKSGRYANDEIWWRVLHLLYFSSVFILIRCVYRVIELSQGNGGFLVTHEVYFYVLDTLPLFIAISIYILFWPGNYIKDEYDSVKEVEEYPLGMPMNGMKDSMDVRRDPMNGRRDPMNSRRDMNSGRRHRSDY